MVVGGGLLRFITPILWFNVIILVGCFNVIWVFKASIAKKTFKLAVALKVIPVIAVNPRKINGLTSGLKTIPVSAFKLIASSNATIGVNSMVVSTPTLLLIDKNPVALVFILVMA